MTEQRATQPSTTSPPGSGSADLTLIDDTELVARITGRDDASLAEALRRHGPSVLGIARRLLADEALSHDVTQDVFVRLWEEPGRFDPSRGKLRTLLLTQAHGRAVDVVRSRNAQRRREDRIAADAPTVADDVDSELMALATAVQVREALASLPPDERTAIELAYFGANTYRQVASLLQVPEGTIKTRIRTGLRRLHDLLRDVEDRPGAASNTSTGDPRPTDPRPTDPRPTDLPTDPRKARP